MRSGLTISALGHAALLVWGLVSFGAKPFDPTPVESLPVDIISDAEFSQMTAGSKKAPPAPAPKPRVEKIAEPKPVDDAVAKISEKAEIVTASAEPRPVEAEIKIPQPKPVPAEARAEPERKEPEKKSSEAQADPIAEALKKEKPQKPEVKKTEVKTPPKKPAPPQPKFDASQIAALLDKRDPQRHAAAGAALNHSPSLGVASGNAPRLTQTEIDALRAQIQACWNPPAGATEGRELIVQVRIMLKPDGSLSAEPILLNQGSNPFFRVAAESAMRAVRRCQPYHLPIAKYDVWKDVEVTFDPRDLYRG
jgi:colicin import membrane protein